MLECLDIRFICSAYREIQRHLQHLINNSREAMAVLSLASLECLGRISSNVPQGVSTTPTKLSSRSQRRFSTCNSDAPPLLKPAARLHSQSNAEDVILA